MTLVFQPIPLLQDVCEHVLLLFLVSRPDLFLVVVDLVLDLFFLLLAVLVPLFALVIALLLVVLAGFLLLFLLLPPVFLLLKPLLLFTPSLKQCCLARRLLLSLSAHVQLTVLVGVLHGLLQNVLSDRRLLRCLLFSGAAHSFARGRRTEPKHFLPGGRVRFTGVAGLLAIVFRRID